MLLLYAHFVIAGYIYAADFMWVDSDGEKK